MRTKKALFPVKLVGMKSDHFLVSPENAGKRIDLLASEATGLSRSRIQHLIDNGLLLVNGNQVKPNYRSKERDEVSLTLPEEEHRLVPEDIPVKIFYMDEFLIVVDKPAGMVVYPAAGHDSGTLMNVIAGRSPNLASIGGPLRPGVVHRLDKDTSGVMVVALDDSAYYNLVEQFRARTITRRYRALVYGNLKEESGEIALKIGRSESDRKKMSTRTRRGKEAVTRWRVIERFQTATLIQAKLGTGRTHQIRVHFAALGHPVLGDRTYGKKTSIEIGRKKILFARQMLHAEVLGFVHPAKGQYVEFSSDLPDDMREKIEDLRDALRPS